jgi:very-short-patch-repair endonuclease
MSSDPMNSTTVQLAKEIARELRQRQTPAETLLWEQVRNRRFLGKKFLRQHPLFFQHNDKPSFFILDFYCHEHNLAIEIDGKSHEYQKDYDRLRTHVINNLGVSVVRFKNEEIERSLNGVMERLKEIMCRQSF